MSKWQKFAIVAVLLGMTSCVHAQKTALGGKMGAGGLSTIQSSAQPTFLITTGSCPAGTLNIAYSCSLASNYGFGAVTYTLNSGSLPPGLSISGSSILGTDTTTSGVYSFQVKATDSASPANTATQNLSISIGCPSLGILTTSPLPSCQQSTSCSLQFLATGGIAPFSWSQTGTLCTGETFTTGGLLSGTPSSVQTCTFQVTVSDSCTTLGASTPLTASETVTQQINGTVAVTTQPTLSSGIANQSYSTQLSAAGGTPGYTWSITSGSLPAGLTLNSSTGAISGTPTAPGVYSFTVQAKDTLNVTGTLLASLTIACPPLNITQPPTTGNVGTLPLGTVGQAYAFQLGASGGYGTLIWSTNSAVPGLTLSPSGSYAGTPTNPGGYSLQITVSDSCPLGTQSDPDSFNLQINPPVVPLKISTASPLTQAIAGTQYSNQMVASGGAGPGYTWQLIGGAFPAGLSMSNLGLISGTPTAATTTAPVIQVTDSASSTSSQTFSITSVCPALSINTASLPVGTNGAAYKATLQALGGYGAITWAATGLPTGLTLNTATGDITGTPSASGSFSVSVTATDSCSPTPQTTAATVYTLQINAQLAITTNSLANGTVSSSYSASMSGVGGTPAYTWSITSGSLPGGLNLNSSTGAITGTPTTAGTSTFTVTLTDSLSATATKVLTIVINANVACGPPTYPCSRSDLNPAPGPSVPPQMGPNTCTAGNLAACGNAIGINTVVTDPDFGNKIVRATDATTATGGMHTAGGGFNSNSTYFTAQTNGSAEILFSFNANTMQVAKCGQFPAVGGGAWAWSYQNPMFLYRMTGTVLSRYNLTGYACGGTLPAPTTIFDFAHDNAHCLDADPNWTANPTSTWHTILNVSNDDTTFSSGFSNSGTQDSGIFIAAYKSGSGCRVLDAQSKTVYGDWGTTGAVSIGYTFTIHGESLGHGGDWVHISWATCSGTCPTTNDIFWQLSTATISAPSGCLSGHSVEGYLSWVNDGQCSHGFQDLIRPFTNLTSYTNIISTYPPGIVAPADKHFSWDAVDANDQYPVAISTWSPTSTLTYAWQNEELAEFTSTYSGVAAGTVRRFVHTFISGINNNSYESKYGLGPTSPDGRFGMFTSDWLGTLGPTGTVTNGQPCPHSVTLTWAAAATPNVTYNVYRSTTTGTGYVKLNTSPISGLSYTDTTVANGTTYYYVVRSVSSTGIESVNSNEVSAVIPASYSPAYCRADVFIYTKR